MMIRNLRILIAGMLVLAMAGASFAQGGSIAVGDSVSDSSTTLTEYTIDLQENETIQISLESTSFDPYVELFDDSGSSIAGDDDGGDGLNSLLVFSAPSDGTYTIRVRSFGSDSPNGDFTLSVESSSVVTEVDGGALSTGATSFEPNGAISTIFTFDAAAGDVITIKVDSSGDEDGRLEVYSPSGENIASDDDSGPGLNPQVTRLELVDGGTYTIEVNGYGDRAMETEFTITVEPTELLLLNDGVQTVTIGESQESDSLALDVTEDSAWLITISTDATESSLYGEFNMPGEIYSSTRFSFSGFSTTTFVYTATEDGRITIDLDFFSFSGDSTFEISAVSLDK